MALIPPLNAPDISKLSAFVQRWLDTLRRYVNTNAPPIPNDATKYLDGTGTYSNPTRYKVGSFTHDISLTGSQSITGVGFKPKAIIGFAQNGSGGFEYVSVIGFCDASLNQLCLTTYQAVGFAGGSGLYYFGDSTNLNQAKFAITSMDTDGFTGTWSKPTGSPTGTETCAYVALY